MWRAMIRPILLLIMLPLVLILVLIQFLAPKDVPRPDWANGVYENPCCAPLVLKDGVARSGGRTARYTVESDKWGYTVVMDSGVGVRGGEVRFEDTFAYVHFNRNSMALPALGDAYALYLLNLDGTGEYVFRKRGQPQGPVAN
jgi:hypothetical protein